MMTSTELTKLLIVYISQTVVNTINTRPEYLHMDRESIDCAGDCNLNIHMDLCECVYAVQHNNPDYSTLIRYITTCLVTEVLHVHHVKILTKPTFFIFQRCPLLN
jgi:hypothetical protein